MCYNRLSKNEKQPFINKVTYDKEKGFHYGVNSYEE